MSVADILRDGLAAYQRGDKHTALASFAQAASIEPGNADAAYLHGFVLSELGRDGEAREPLERAVALVPGNAAFRGALALCLKGLGRIAEAHTEFERALALAPNDIGIAFNYANTLDGGAAVAVYARVLALDPTHGGARLNRANALAGLGRWRDAFDDYAQLPNDPRALIGLAGAALQLDRAQVAHDAAQAALRFGDDPNAWFNLGAALGMLGRTDDALAAFDKAGSDPKIVPAKATALNRAHRYDEALTALDGAAPDFEVWMALGNAQAGRGFYAAASDAFAHAVALRPGDPDAATNHANALLYRGEADRACALLAKLPVSSSALYALSYADATTPDALLEAHRDWAKRFAPVVAPAVRNARPRIGYVSADFCAHSCAHVLRAVLPNHDRDNVEIHAFSNVAAEDAVTAELKAHFDHWHDIAGLDDDAAADLVRQERIDLLIDLSGPPGGHRLGVFARKPASRQATWLGYPATTGLAQIDFRLVDRVSDPAPSMTEAPAFIQGGFLAYAPPPNAPEPSRIGTGPVFGSFNNLAKLSPATIALWSKLLRAMPDAKLILKARSFEEAATRAAILAKFGDVAARVELHGWLGAHLDLYRAIDLALDPLPYNGTITTFEALWMGVPVVTLPGHTHASRVGASILHHAGFGGWIAKDEQGFIDRGVRLAKTPPPREQVRARFAASSLMDGKRIARAIEALTGGP
ncbi:MAG: tetratricopeptide repeat protein [Alphaproteobacteria bacterium]|nr:tetratricopeptide repeat protein [Alphaproteobacteria bacterium]